MMDHFLKMSAGLDEFLNRCEAIDDLRKAERRDNSPTIRGYLEKLKNRIAQTEHAIDRDRERMQFLDAELIESRLPAGPLAFLDVALIESQLQRKRGY